MSFFRVLPIIFVSAVVFGAEPKKETPYTPRVLGASKEGEEAIKRFQVDKSLKIDLWAAEPMLANPVCFCFDEKGRCFVAETFRHSAGATDNRGRPWLDDDLACRTVEDRVAMFKKYAKDRFTQEYEKEHDRVRLLEDTSGSGKADKTTVFRDDFGNAADGIGAGLLARNGNVYFACIPDLWLLKDSKGSGQADVKKSLSTGYGIHVAFIGHDLHGLRMGPDGKLYFSIGDRGLNVHTREAKWSSGEGIKFETERSKQIFNPDSGAVLRCDPDGGHLEIVHIGLRNPQELAFDDYGNLFTVDNNSDSGDRARFVQIVEGGDSGWRIGYQYGSEMHDSKVVRQGNRGPWNYEKLWHPYHEGQPAYIVPPITNFADGPSGFTHYPGVGLPEKFKGHFFLCDFRGSAGGSGVWSFTTKAKGASFEMVNPQHFVWNILATDCDFGPDCGFYISDWTNGWDKPGKGRLYKVTDPEAQRKDVVRDVKEILAKGFGELKIDELTKLLAHPHQQIRQGGIQFALAAKGKEAIEPLANVARNGKDRLARIHAIWGLGMVGRNSDVAAHEPLVALLKDADPELRAQAARSLGGGQSDEALNGLLKLLDDPEPRVVFFAALSLAVRAAARTYDMTLYLDRDGNLLTATKDGKESKFTAESEFENYFNDLFKSVANELGERGAKELVILLRCEKEAKYSRLVSVMNATRQAGFKDVAIAPTKSKESATTDLRGITAIARQAQRNADADPYLRLALSRALAALAGESIDGGLHRDPSPAVRMVAVLAWRHTFEFRTPRIRADAAATRRSPMFS